MHVGWNIKLLLNHNIFLVRVIKFLLWYIFKIQTKKVGSKKLSHICNLYHVTDIYLKNKLKPSYYLTNFAFLYLSVSKIGLYRHFLFSVWNLLTILRRALFKKLNLFSEVSISIILLVMISTSTMKIISRLKIAPNMADPITLNKNLP